MTKNQASAWCLMLNRILQTRPETGRVFPSRHGPIPRAGSGRYVYLSGVRCTPSWCNLSSKLLSIESWNQWVRRASKVAVTMCFYSLGLQASV